MNLSRPRRLWHPAFMTAVAAAMLAAVAACGEPSDAGDAAATPVPSIQVGVADGAGSPTGAAALTSAGSSTKRFMGSSTVLIGGSMENASANAAPFDVQYSYVVSR